MIDALHRRGKQADAYRVMGEILTPELLGQSRDVVLLEAHANLLGRGGHCRDAAADYARLIEIAPTDHWLCHQYAPVLVLAHDLEGYWQFCRRLLARFSSTEDPDVSSLMALDCLCRSLLPALTCAP